MAGVYFVRRHGQGEYYEGCNYENGKQKHIFSPYLFQAKEFRTVSGASKAVKRLGCVGYDDVYISDSSGNALRE